MTKILARYREWGIKNGAHYIRKTPPNFVSTEHYIKKYGDYYLYPNCDPIAVMSPGDNSIHVFSPPESLAEFHAHQDILEIDYFRAFRRIEAVALREYRNERRVALETARRENCGVGFNFTLVTCDYIFPDARILERITL